MAVKGNKKEEEQQRILSVEQEALLDLYLEKLDNFFEDLHTSEKVQAEIETLHLKRILSK